MEISIFGAGGYAKVLIDIILAIGHQVEGVYDDDESKWDTEVLDYKIKGGANQIKNSQSTNLVVALGNNKIRKKIYEQFDQTNHVTIVHPSAITYPSVKIGKGCVIRENVVLQSSCEIGDYSIISSNTVVGHDAVLKKFIYLAPNIVIGGESVLEEGVFMGMNSSIIPQRAIGKWSVVGANSVVISNLGEQVTAVGTPAKAKK